MHDNQMLHFAYADFEEGRRKYENAKKVYDQLLSREKVDPTLVSKNHPINQNYRLNMSRLIFN
jgi:hypothetical protein